MTRRSLPPIVPGTLLLVLLASGPLHAQDDGARRLVGSLLEDTPLVQDLQTLTDEIGGRATGSPANLQSRRLGRRTVSRGRRHGPARAVHDAGALARALGRPRR